MTFQYRSKSKDRNDFSHDRNMRISIRKWEQESVCLIFCLCCKQTSEVCGWGQGACPNAHPGSSIFAIGFLR